MSKKTNSQEQEKRWSSITGKMRIFSDEVKFKRGGKEHSFLRFSTNIGVKDDAGEWDNLYFDVRFKKDEEPEDDIAEIDIKAGFITFTTYQDKKGNTVKKPCIMVLDWE